jgi:hypothetical protein
MSELIDTWIEITNSTLDRAGKVEEELVVALKKLEHLCHLEKYY